MRAPGDRVRLAVSRAGWLFAPIWVITVIALTVSERHYLTSVGWSPTGRTDTQWPSILGTGPHGWVFAIATGMAAGVCCCLAWLTFTSRHVRGGHLHAVAVGLIAAGLVAVTIPADAPHHTAASSWHATVHNSGYPLIPLGALAGLGIAALSRSGSSLRRPARLLLPVTGAAFAVSATDTYGQLARYFAFAGVATWVALVARDARR